jgi:hypothetical protein
MVHRVQVVTTLSMLWSSSGTASAEPSMKATGIAADLHEALRATAERTLRNIDGETPDLTPA